MLCLCKFLGNDTEHGAFQRVHADNKHDLHPDDKPVRCSYRGQPAIRGVFLYDRDFRDLDDKLRMERGLHKLDVPDRGRKHYERRILLLGGKPFQYDHLDDSKSSVHSIHAYHGYGDYK